MITGLTLVNSIERMDLAGSDVTQYLHVRWQQTLTVSIPSHLLQLLLRKTGCTFTTSSELEIVREIKESCCLISQSHDMEELQGIPTVCNTANQRYSKAGEKGVVQYQLPDGQMLEVRVPRLLLLCH